MSRIDSSLYCLLCRCRTLLGGMGTRFGKHLLLSFGLSLRLRIGACWAVAGMISCLVALAGVDRIARHSLEQGYGGYTPRLTAVQVSSRCLSLFAGFSTAARLAREPQFHDEWFTEQMCKVRGGSRHRPVWTVLCDADGARYCVQFNDRTGNLIGWRPDNGVKAHLAQKSGVVSIKTPSGAASVAMMCLAELYLIPMGTQVTLEFDPQSVEHGQAWEVVWQAHPPLPARPYEIRLLLARKGGAPILLLNHRELEQYPFEGLRGREQ